MIARSKWEARAERQFQLNRIAVAVFVTNADGSRMVADPVNLIRHDIDDRFEPAFTLSYEEAQTLADDLWHAGVRPSAAAGSIGQVAALNNHLQDMRAIAGGLLRPIGVEIKP